MTEVGMTSGLRRLRVALTPCMIMSAVTLGSGCASQSHTTKGAGYAQRQTRATQLIVEEFDPRLVREDLLLIQPAFKPPAVPPATARDIPADADSTAFAAADQGKWRPQAAPSAVDSTDVLVYRVQVIALSKETAAAALAAELEMLLGLRVVLEPEGGLFAVRAGALDTPDAAERLRDRITALRGDYREAFVINDHRRAATQVLADAPADPLLAEDPPWESIEDSPPELVSIDGWRVLIDQFLSLPEAERLRQKARLRLDRADIFIDFREPYYKVKAGNYRSSAKAQEATDQIRRRGYRGALKVRSLIDVPKGEM